MENETQWDLTVAATSHPVDDNAGIYFSSAYGQADAVTGDQEWITIRGAEGRWQIPLLLAELPQGQKEAKSPYGYSGIYVDPSLSSASVRVLWYNTLAALRSLNVVSMFLRFSPFIPIPESIAGLEHLVLRALQPTVLVPTNTPQEMWKGMEGRSRTAIRKAERLQMVFEIESAETDKVDLWEQFKEVYNGTMQRLDAQDRYLFSDRYYQALSVALAEKLQIANVRSVDGTLLSSSLIMTDKRTAHYHLSGSRREGAQNGSNNLMIWGVAQWAASKGIEALHLGGGLREGDSLFKFKRSFGGRLCPFYVGQVILDADEYSRLVSISATQQGVSVEQLVTSGFFPAYNAKI